MHSNEWVRYVDHLKATGRVPGAGSGDRRCGVVHANNVTVINVRAFLLSQTAPAAAGPMPHPVRIDHVGSRFVPETQFAVSEVICEIPEDEAVLDQNPAASAYAEEDCVQHGDDRIPASWLDVDSVSTGTARQPQEVVMEDADCWAPQNVHHMAGASSGITPRQAIDGAESGLDEHSVAHDHTGISCDSSEGAHGDTDDVEDVPNGRQSCEDIAATHAEPLNTIASVNEELSIQPSPALKRTRKLQFAPYDVVAYYDKRKSEWGPEVAIPPRRGEIWAQLPSASAKVLHAKRFDGKWSDLPSDAVREVDFLEPRVAYKVSGGRLERKPHFVFLERTRAPSRAVFHDSAGEASEVDGSDNEGDVSYDRAAGLKTFMQGTELPIGQVDVDELSSDEEVAYF